MLARAPMMSCSATHRGLREQGICNVGVSVGGEHVGSKSESNDAASGVIAVGRHNVVDKTRQNLKSKHIW